MTDLIKHPVFSEKSINSLENNQCYFIVSPQVTKKHAYYILGQVYGLPIRSIRSLFSRMRDKNKQRNKNKKKIIVSFYKNKPIKLLDQ